MVPATHKGETNMESFAAMISFYRARENERDPEATEYLSLEDYDSPEDMTDTAAEMADKAVRRGAYAYAEVVLEVTELDAKGDRASGTEPQYSGILAFSGDWKHGGHQTEPAVQDLAEIFGD